jgi:hypothetical protein
LAAGESGNCGDGTKYTGCWGLDYGLEGQPPTPSLVIRTRKLSGIEPLGYLTDVLQPIVSGRTKTRTARTVSVELASAIRLRCDHRYDSSSCRLVGVPRVDAVVAPRRLRAANDGSAKHPIIMPIFSRLPIAPTSWDFRDNSRVGLSGTWSPRRCYSPFSSDDPSESCASGPAWGAKISNVVS